MSFSSLPLGEPLPSAPEPERKGLRWQYILALAGFLVLASTIAWLLPGFHNIAPDTTGEPILIWQNKKISPPHEPAVVEQDGSFYFHVPLLQSLLDPNIFWDPEEGYLAITTEDKLLQMDSTQLTWHLNQEPFELRFPLLMIEGEPYLDLEPLEFVYPLDLNYIADTNRMIVSDSQIPTIGAKINKKKAWLRAEPHLRSGRLAQVLFDEELILLSEDRHWAEVQTTKGLIGYLPKRQLNLAGILWSEKPRTVDRPPWKPIGGKINLVWEHVAHPAGNPKTDILDSLEGVNVYSPTWFHLADAQGNIINYANSSLADQARREGKQIWALFSNSFDPEMTAEFLHNPQARNQAISQLMAYTQMYQLDGINIDFENIPAKNKDLLVQFVRELAPMLREQGLVVSMDVTFKSNSGSWSLIYDRQALGEAVDYLMIMAYDEHWATSPVPGSVASLPWVENGLKAILKEVPPEKIILGLPLYARLWTVTKEGDQSSVSSKAWSMNQTQKWLKENNLEPSLDPTTGQYFAQLENGNQHYLLWLEDENSLAKRVELVHQYGLAGVASWQRGFAKKEIWPALARYLADPSSVH